MIVSRPPIGIFQVISPVAVSAAEIIEKFMAEKGFTRFGLYIQDYGGPVGFRLMTKNPKILEWLIIQNTNAFEEGFSGAWASLRDQLWRNRNAQTEAANEGLLQLATVKAAYLTGSPIPELISPDNWNFDYHVTLQRTHGRQLQMDLFYDYRTNVDLYPAWQGFLKQHQPKTIIFWGQGDIFFTPQGGEAYLTLLPHAEMHRLNAGHFAVEDCLPYIAEKMIDSIHRKFGQQRRPACNNARSRSESKSRECVRDVQHRT